MKKILSTPVVSLGRTLSLALLLFASTSLYAQGSSLTLKGDAEVPPVPGAGSGSGQISVQPDHSVSGSIKVTGFPATAAHIHEGAAGKNGPVAVPLEKTADDVFTVPSGSRLSEAQYTAYMAGNLYVNVHSAAHPGGEIRAQLVPGGGAKEGAKMPARSGSY